MRWWQIRKRDADLERELQSDLELEEEEQRERGLSPEEARYAARRAFGNSTLIGNRLTKPGAGRHSNGFLQDVRYALRQLRRSPGFTFTAILILAIGIGAVTSVFSVINGVLLKPFAFRDPDRLVVMREAVYEEGNERTAVPDNYRHFLRLKNTATTLEDAAIFAQRGLSVSPNGDHPRIVGAVLASPNLLQVLGVQPMLGRNFIGQRCPKRRGRCRCIEL